MSVQQEKRRLLTRCCEVANVLIPFVGESRYPWRLQCCWSSCCHGLLLPNAAAAARDAWFRWSRVVLCVFGCTDC